jgi:intein/homing endonuclease
MSLSYEEEREEKVKKKPRAFLESEQITLSRPKRPHNPNLPKNYYFDNEYVESLLTEYVKGGCTKKLLRDEIMANASELIRQIIRTHKLHTLANGREGTAFGDLYQLAWCQIESSLYKFDYQPGHTKVFNMWCVSPDTLLMTDHGVDTIGRMLYNGTGIQDQVYGLDGFNKLSATLCRPETPTLDIKTHLGYQIEATPEHRFYILTDHGPEWVEAKQLKTNDLMGIQYDQNAFLNDDDIDIDIDLHESGEWNPPSSITEELAYIIGLYIAEGSWSYGKLVIYNIDQDVIDVLVDNQLGLNFIHEPKYQRISLCNVRFIEFMRVLGFEDHSRSYKKFIPSRLLKCSRQVLASVLNGMFDGDGHSSRHNGEVGYTSSSKFLINQLRMVLLNFGMLSKLSFDNRIESAFKGKVRPRRPGYQLILSTDDSKKFYKDIGFKIQRKMLKSKYLKSAKIEMFGLVPHFKTLKENYGCGKLGYNKIRSLLKNKSGVCFLNQTKNRLENWAEWSDDLSYQFILERIDERSRNHNKIAWLPIASIKESSSPVCEITVDSSNHSYIANGFVSHNSQVAKTVMLAHIKKESRDKRNYGAYKEHLDAKGSKNNFKLERFIEEAKGICGYDDVHMDILNALQNLCEEDDRPHDGLIDKLVKRTGYSRVKISNFIRTIRLRSFEFSDAPVNKEDFQPENKYRVVNSNYDSDDD